MKNILSRFTLRYPAVLTYMLQTSEYYVGDYIEWLHHVSDFRKVEKAGKLRYTLKTISLLGIIWLFYLGSVVKLLFLAEAFWSSIGVIFLLAVLLVPFLLPYLAIIPVLVLKYLVQKPLELLIYGGLKRKIAAHPAKKVAIAGSYGKTTMREILATVIGAGKKVAAPKGSLNTLWGINTFMKSLSGDEEVLIFELGEYYPGDVMRLAKLVRPDLGVITGINEAHLKRFKTIERTVATIYELVDFLGEKPVYINGDNVLARENSRGNYTIYGEKGTKEWEVEKEKTDLSGIELTLKNGKKSLPFHSKLLGPHLIGSLVAAVQIADGLGLTSEQIEKGVADTKPFPRRLQDVSTDPNITILDDSYNGNPDGVRVVIDFLASIKGRRRIYVTSGLVEMGAKNREVHLTIGKQLAMSGIEIVILVRTSASEIIAEGLEKNGYKGQIIYYDDTETAYNSLPLLLVKGDFVLLQNDWPDQYR